MLPALGFDPRTFRLGSIGMTSVPSLRLYLHFLQFFPKLVATNLSGVVATADGNQLCPVIELTQSVYILEEKLSICLSNVLPQ